MQTKHNFLETTVAYKIMKKFVVTLKLYSIYLNCTNPNKLFEWISLVHFASPSKSTRKEITLCKSHSQFFPDFSINTRSSMKGLNEMWYNFDHLGEDFRVTCNKLGGKMDSIGSTPIFTWPIGRNPGGGEDISPTLWKCPTDFHFFTQ